MLIAEFIVEVGILIFVALEYLESKALNTKLNRVYRSKKRKDKLVKAIISSAEVQ